jgi:hypothetical protein
VPKTSELELLVNTSVGVVRSGDKLVVAVPGNFSDKELHDHANQLEDSLPGVEVIIVRATALVVYRR